MGKEVPGVAAVITYAALPLSMRDDVLNFRPPSGEVVVYGLYGPDGHLRYIGKTKQRLGRRIVAHRRRARQGLTSTHCDNWLRSIDCAPLVGILGLFTDQEWQLADRTWIADARLRGANLTNAAPGGEGYAGWHHSVESRARISAGTRGRRPTLEQVARRVATRKARYQHHSDVTRARISAKMQELAQITQVCARCGRACRGVVGLRVHESKIHE